MSQNYRFFNHRECEYYPCHSMKPEEMNCLFCFCPSLPHTPRIALNQFLMELQGVCRNFSAKIATLTRGGATTEDLQPLIDKYHINCLGEQVASTTDDAGDTSGDADDTNVVSVDPAVAAENVAAGLCPDGSKPNKFGCCAGETGTDGEPTACGVLSAPMKFKNLLHTDIL